MPAKCPPPPQHERPAPFSWCRSPTCGQYGEGRVLWSPFSAGRDFLALVTHSGSVFYYHFMLRFPLICQPSAWYICVHCLSTFSALSHCECKFQQRKWADTEWDGLLDFITYHMCIIVIIVKNLQYIYTKQLTLSTARLCKYCITEVGI